MGCTGAIVPLDDVPPHTDDEADAALSDDTDEIIALEDLPGSDIPGPDDWRRGLTTHATDNGNVIDKTAGNLTLLLTHDEPWSGVIAYDELSHSVRWRRTPPRIPGMDPPIGLLIDEHLIYVQQSARRTWGAQWGIEAVSCAVQASARYHRYHPVRDYLLKLEWDAQPRCDKWLQSYHHAEPTDARIGTWWLVSAVARAMRPGCQADHLLVLQGRQGAGKSTALRILGGEWYSGALGDLRDKDAQQNLLGAWLVEIGELDALRDAASTRVKDFLSQTRDRYRPSYGRYVVDRPRQCVFAATTNEHEFLRDASGARRFWPIRVGELLRDELTRDRDQIWAEAVYWWQTGDCWWPTDAEQLATLAEAAEERYASDPWEQPIREWLATQDGSIRMSECFVRLGLELGRTGRRESARMGAILRRAGWVARRNMRERYWEREKRNEGYVEATHDTGI